MTLMPTSVRSLRTLFKDAFVLYKKSLITVLPVATLYFLFLFISHFALLQWPKNSIHGHAVDITLSILNVCMQPFIFGALLIGLRAFAMGQSMQYKEMLVTCLRRYVMLLSGFLIFLALVSAGTLLFVVPGLIAALFLTFFYFFVLFENQNSIRALISSAKLAWRHFGKVVMFVLLALILFLVLSVLTAVIISSFNFLLAHILKWFHLTTDPIGTAKNVGAVIMIVVPPLLLPLSMSLLLQFYFELKLLDAQKAEETLPAQV